MSWEDTITTDFSLRHGKFKTDKVTSAGGYSRRDLSKGTTDGETFYTYDKSDRLSSASSSHNADGVDAWNNHTYSDTTSTAAQFVIYAGAAKAIESVTNTHTRNIDRSWNDNRDDQKITYDDGGRLLGATTKGSSTGGDGFVSLNQSTTDTIFMVAFGSLVPFESLTASSGGNTRGEWNNATNVTRFYYTYAPKWLTYKYSVLDSFQLPEAWTVSPHPVSGGAVASATTHAYPTLPRPAELSAWYLGAMVDDVFNHGGVHLDPFLNYENRTELNSEALAAGTYTTEVGGVSVSRVIGDTNLMRVVHEEVGHLGDLRMTTVNITGWYDVDYTKGYRYADYFYDLLNAQFIDGYSYHYLFFDKREVTNPNGNSYFIAFGGESQSEAYYVNVAGKRVVAWDRTTNNEFMTIDGRRASESEGETYSETAYDLSTGIMASKVSHALHDSHTLPLCEGCTTGGGQSAFPDLGELSHSDSWTYSYNTIGYMDAEHTDSFSWSWNKWRTAYSETTSAVDRYWDASGELGAEDSFSTDTANAYYRNPTGTAGEETPVGAEGASGVTHAEGYNTYTIYQWVGEQIASSHTESGNSGSEAMTTTDTFYEREGNGQGISAVSTSVTEDPSNPWVQTNTTYMSRDYGEHERVDSVQEENLTGLGFSEVAKAVPVHLQIVREYGYGAGAILQSVNAMGRGQVEFQSYEGTYADVKSLVEDIHGPGAVKDGGAPYFDTMDKANNNDITVDYKEVWSVNVGGDAQMDQKLEHLEYVGWLEQASADGGHEFKANNFRLKRLESYAYDGDVRSQTKVTQSNVNFATHQVSWPKVAGETDDWFNFQSEFYVYSHIMQFTLRKYDPFGEGGGLRGDMEPDLDGRAGFGPTPFDEELLEMHVQLSNAKVGGVWVTTIDFKSVITLPGIMTRYVKDSSRLEFEVTDFELPGLGSELYWGPSGAAGGTPVGFGAAGEGGGANTRDLNKALIRTYGNPIFVMNPDAPRPFNVGNIGADWNNGAFTPQFYLPSWLRDLGWEDGTFYMSDEIPGWLEALKKGAQSDDSDENGELVERQDKDLDNAHEDPEAGLEEFKAKDQNRESQARAADDNLASNDRIENAPPPGEGPSMPVPQASRVKPKTESRFKRNEPLNRPFPNSGGGMPAFSYQTGANLEGFRRVGLGNALYSVPEFNAGLNAHFDLLDSEDFGSLLRLLPASSPIRARLQDVQRTMTSAPAPRAPTFSAQRIFNDRAQRGPASPAFQAPRAKAGQTNPGATGLLTALFSTLPTVTVHTDSPNSSQPGALPPVPSVPGLSRTDTAPSNNETAVPAQLERPIAAPPVPTVNDEKRSPLAPASQQQQAANALSARPAPQSSNSRPFVAEEKNPVAADRLQQPSAGFEPFIGHDVFNAPSALLELGRQVLPAVRSAAGALFAPFASTRGIDDGRGRSGPVALLMQEAARALTSAGPLGSNDVPSSRAELPSPRSPLSGVRGERFAGTAPTVTADVERSEALPITDRRGTGVTALPTAASSARGAAPLPVQSTAEELNQVAPVRGDSLHLMLQAKGSAAQPLGVSTDRQGRAALSSGNGALLRPGENVSLRAGDTLISARIVDGGLEVASTHADQVAAALSNTVPTELLESGVFVLRVEGSAGTSLVRLADLSVKNGGVEVRNVGGTVLTQRELNEGHGIAAFVDGNSVALSPTAPSAATFTLASPPSVASLRLIEALRPQARVVGGDSSAAVIPVTLVNQKGEVRPDTLIASASGLRLVTPLDPGERVQIATPFGTLEARAGGNRALQAAEFIPLRQNPAPRRLAPAILEARANFQFARTLDNFIKFAQVSPAAAAIASLGLTTGIPDAVLRATSNLFGLVSDISGFTLGGSELVTALIAGINSFSGYLSSVARPFIPLQIQTRLTQSRFDYVLNVTASTDAKGQLIARDLGGIDIFSAAFKTDGDFATAKLAILKNISLTGEKFQDAPNRWSAIRQMVQSPDLQGRNITPLRLAFVRNPQTNNNEVVLIGLEQIKTAKGREEQAVMILPHGSILTYPAQELPEVTAQNRLIGQNPSQFSRNTIVPIQKIEDRKNMNLNQSFAPTHRVAVDGDALAHSLSIFAPDLAASLTWQREQAGVVLVDRTTSGLKIMGARLFKTVALGSEGDGRPTERQLRFVAAVNQVWNSGVTDTEIRVSLDRLAATFGDVTANDLWTAEAFATSGGIAVLDKAYANVPGAFVPFHTHLGHPENFEGLARYAPTSADIWSHRALMSKTARRHGSDLSIPGLIIHADGRLTTFWAPAADGMAVRLNVSGLGDGRVSVDELAAAEITHALQVRTDGTAAEKTRQVREERALDLWDGRRKVFVRREEAAA